MRISTLFLLFAFIGFVTEAQTNPTFVSHQIIDIGNNTKVEILRSRGEGISEECEVIYFTTKRQDGKRMWQSVRQLKEEERAGRIAKEAANPLLKKNSTVNLTTNINTSTDALKNIAKVAVRPAGPTLQEIVKKADSAAKARAKIIDAQLLATIEKEDSSDQDSTTPLLIHVGIDTKENQISTPPLEKYISPSIEHSRQVTKETIKEKKAISIGIDTASSIEVPQMELESDSETFVKNYAPPTNSGISTEKKMSNTTLHEEAVQINSSKIISAEPKAPIAETEISFPTATNHFTAIETRGVFKVKVDNPQIQIVKQKNKDVTITSSQIVNPKSTSTLTSPSFLEVKILRPSIKSIQLKKEIPSVIATKGIVENGPSVQIKTTPIFVLQMDNSKIRITQREKSTSALITKTSKEKSTTNTFIATPIFSVRIDNSHVKKIVSQKINPSHTIEKNTAPNATARLEKKSIFAVKIDSGSIRVNGSQRIMEPASSKKMILHYVTIPLVQQSNFVVKIDNRLVKVNISAKTAINNEKLIDKDFTIPIIVKPVFVVAINNSSVNIKMPQVQIIKNVPEKITSSYSTSAIQTQPFFTLHINPDKVQIVMQKSLNAAKINPPISPVQDSTIASSTKETNHKIDMVNKVSLANSTSSVATNNQSDSAYYVTNIISTTNDFLKRIEINKNGKWKKGIIIDKENETRYKVHYQTYNNDDDEWVMASTIRPIDSVANNTHYVSTALQLSFSESSNRNNKFTCNSIKASPIIEEEIFNEKIAINKILELNNKAKSSNAGITILYLQTEPPYFNIANKDSVETSLKYPSAPEGVSIYPLKAKYKICYQASGKIINISEDGKYSFFRNNTSNWECKKDN